MALPIARARGARPPLPPGPRYATPFSFLRELRADTLGYLEGLQRDYGDVVCLRLGPVLRSCLLVRPEGVRRVLVENHRNYWKGRLFGKLKRVSGEGLLFSEGEAWRRQRRLVAPAFQRSHVQSLVPAMGAVVEEMLERWERERADGRPFDLLPEMSQLALDVVCRALFGGRRLGPEVRFHETVNEAIGYANHLLNTFLPAPLWVPTRRNRRARRTQADIHAVIDDLIRQARERRSEGFDLLRLLMEARDEESGEPMSEAALRDQMVTFLIAGHETTAVALTWAVHLLGSAPEEAEALRAEADAVLGTGPASAEAVARLERTRRVLKESLRLYPPAWAIARQAHADDEVCGYRIPRGSNVTLSPWLLHRHPGLWEAPERFDPDRFRPERAAGRPRGAYFPFGAGGRRCVGEDFATLEATLVLASLLRRFRVEPVPGEHVEPDPILTLRPRSGLRVTVAPR